MLKRNLKPKIQTESPGREIEAIKNTIELLDLKNTTIQMESSMDRLNSRMERTQKIINVKI